MGFSSPNAIDRSDTVIPRGLVGVWAREGAQLHQGKIIEGTGLYIGPDGIGAIQLTQPKVIRRIVIGFDQRRSTLNILETENRRVVFSRTLRFDKRNRTITLTDGSKTVLHRVFPVFRVGVRHQLGVEPQRSPVHAYFNNQKGLEDFYRVYWYYEGPKAFAVSGDGYYGYSGARMLSQQAALNQALKYCERHRNVGSPPCRQLTIVDPGR